MRDFTLSHLDPVPFTVENESHLGLSETQGLLSSDGRSLLLEWRIADTIVGLVKTASQRLEIPLEEVSSISLQRRMMGMVNEIAIRVRTQALLDDFPEAKLGSLKLRVARREREGAADFCLALRDALGRRRGERLEDDLRRLEGE